MSDLPQVLDMMSNTSGKSAVEQVQTTTTGSTGGHFQRKLLSYLLTVLKGDRPHTLPQQVTGKPRDILITPIMDRKKPIPSEQASTEKQGRFGEPARPMGIFTKHEDLHDCLNDFAFSDQQRRQFEDFVLLLREQEAINTLCGNTKNRQSSSLVILSGPTGTGKTTLARILTRELKTNLYELNFAEIQSSLVGDTEKNLTRAFDEANTNKALLFLDEADTLASNRTTIIHGSDRCFNNEVNQLIRLLDRHQGVVIMATNKLSDFDPAIRRRGRVFELQAPDTSQRLSLWKHFLAKAVLETEADQEWINKLEKLLSQSGYLSHFDRPFGAMDIQQVIEMAAVMKLRKTPLGKEHAQIERRDLEQALKEHLHNQQQEYGNRKMPIDIVPTILQGIHDSMHNLAGQFQELHSGLQDFTISYKNKAEQSAHQEAQNKLGIVGEKILQLADHLQRSGLTQNCTIQNLENYKNLCKYYSCNQPAPKRIEVTSPLQ